MIAHRTRNFFRRSNTSLFGQVNSILITLMIAIVVSISPFYEILKKLTGISFYSKLAAVILIISIVEMIRDRKILFLIKKENYLSNFVLLNFLLVLCFSHITLNNVYVVFAAILTPYLFGVVVSSDPVFLRRFCYFLVYILIIKVYLALLYILYNDQNLAFTPQLGDRALYLYVVNYFELIPSFAILLLPDYLGRFYFITKRRYLIHLVVLIVLLAIAIPISILNARAAIINSLLITVLLTFVFSKYKSVNFYGYFIYPLILFAALLMTPLRFEFIKRLFYQFENYFEYIFLGASFKSIDGSFVERLGNIQHSFNDRNLNLINYSSDKVINGSHLWPAQIYYAGGLVALILFMGLLVLAGLKILKVSSRYGKNSELFLKAFSIASFSHIFYYGNFLNSVTFFLFLGLILNLETRHKSVK